MTNTTKQATYFEINGMGCNNTAFYVKATTQKEIDLMETHTLELQDKNPSGIFQRVSNADDNNSISIEDYSMLFCVEL